MKITDEILNKILADIKNKASNNKENQAYIHPSRFGVDNNSEVTKKVADILSQLPEVKTANVAGRDLIDVIIQDLN